MILQLSYSFLHVVHAFGWWSREVASRSSYVAVTEPSYSSCCLGKAKREGEYHARLQSASLVERNSLQARLMALPQQGSSGVVGSWLEAIVRGHKSKCKILEFQAPSSFKVEFEQWKIGENDPDDGVYDLLNAEISWKLTDPPSRQHVNSPAMSTRGRVATRNRHY